MIPENILRHRISNKEKYANDSEWAIQYIDTIIPSFTRTSSHSHLYDEMLSNYRLYNNIINQEEFDKFCNYYGVDVGAIQDEILPYNKTYAKINLLCGEELKRGSGYKVHLANDVAIKRKDDELRAKISERIDQELNLVVREQEMLQQGIPQEQIDLQLKEEKEKLAPDLNIKEFRSELEILANHIINYGTYDQNVKSQKNEGFKHALLTDLEMVYVGMHRGKPIIKVMNSINSFFHKSPETKYIQDGDYAGRRWMTTRFQAMDEYLDIMSEKDKDTFMNRFGPTLRSGGLNKAPDMNFENTQRYRDLHRLNAEANIYEGVGSYSTDKNFTYKYDNVEVIHVEFKTEREVGFLTTYNEFGYEVIDIVSDEFKVPKNATKINFINKFGNNTVKYEWSDFEGRYNCIEWIWIPRVWEATRIDGDIYVNIREKPNQPFSINDPYGSCKLGYHGVVFHDMNAKSVSVMSRMKPFQYLYFIAMNQMNHLVSRNFGPVLNYDLAQTPDFQDKYGRDNMEMSLYYLTKGLVFYNSMQNTQGGQMPSNRGNAVEVKNMSSTQDILNLSQMLEWLDEQIGMAAGVSKQRESQISANTNVTDNQQAIAQSMHITELIFNLHNDLWKHIFNSYISIFKFWVKQHFENNEGKREMVLNYMLPEGTSELFKVTPEHLEDVEFGLFVTDSGNSEAYRQQITQLLQPMIQNQMQGAVAISEILKGVVNGDSPEQIHKQIKTLSDEVQKRLEKQQEADTEIQKQSLALQREMQERSFSMEKELATVKELLKRQTEISKIELNNAAASESELGWLENERMYIESENELKRQQHDLDKRKQALEEKKHKDDVVLTEEELRIKEIAARKKPSSSSK